MYVCVYSNYKWTYNIHFNIGYLDFEEKYQKLRFFAIFVSKTSKYGILNVTILK